MSISTIFFDVGGTLIFPDLDRLMAPLLARGVRPTSDQLQRADRAAKVVRVNDDAPANVGHWNIYFTTLLGEVGHDDLLPELSERANDSSHWTKVAPHASETLAQLRHEFRLAVISNADGRIRDVLARAGLVDYFENITDSGLAGFEKPDRRIFDAAMREMRVAAAESAYAGDIYGIDYVGATGAGMNAVLVDFPGAYRTMDVPRVESLPELATWVRARRDGNGTTAE